MEVCDFNCHRSSSKGNFSFGNGEAWFRRNDGAHFCKSHCCWWRQLVCSRYRAPNHRTALVLAHHSYFETRGSRIPQPRCPICFRACLQDADGFQDVYSVQRSGFSGGSVEFHRPGYEKTWGIPWWIWRSYNCQRMWLFVFGMVCSYVLGKKLMWRNEYLIIYKITKDLLLDECGGK